MLNNIKNKLAKKNSIKGQSTDNLQLFLLQLPVLVYIFIFGYIPMYGIIIAFKNFNPNLGIFGSPWAGLTNFEFFFASQDAWRVIRNTVLYSLWFLFQGPVVAMTTALLLYNLTRRFLVKIYNTIMILPHFMSMVLISFIVYALLNPSSGVVNQLIEYFGGEAVDWYAKPKAWIVILPLVRMWQTAGTSCLLYYATLMGINTELFEAAEIDGASKFQQTIKIAVPELMAVVAIQTIMGFGSIFNGDFGLFYQVTRNVGTLYPTTDIINTYTFRTMMSGAFSKSAAVGLMQSVVGVFLTFAVNFVVRKINSDYSLF